MYTMSNINDAKVVFLGRAAVGKTSIIEHYCRKVFNKYQEPTIGAAFNTIVVPTSPETTRIGIWDTAGQERYDSLCSMYYRNAVCAVVVYDITDKESLAKANAWLSTIKMEYPNTSLILVGSKNDLEENRVVQYEYAHAIAQDFMAGFYEVSGKSGKGLDILFRRIGNIVRVHTAGSSMQLQKKLEKPKPERDWCYLHFNGCC